ncbi:hypothetical protein XCR_0130 [Xanthomonas campestris pv. raphani 756C]|nr:hypothetical protein XCR_0130 [Xanthomonas campestris pv. raphani 756C]
MGEHGCVSVDRSDCCGRCLGPPTSRRWRPVGTEPDTSHPAAPRLGVALPQPAGLQAYEALGIFSLQGAGGVAGCRCAIQVAGRVGRNRKLSVRCARRVAGRVALRPTRRPETALRAPVSDQDYCHALVP